ncbi:MAG: alpha/beta hydrolase [Wenzhouxiangella sp.]|nr:alpha/beta hydrolase [Wenzhouxiangella sp.]
MKKRLVIIPVAALLLFLAAQLQAEQKWPGMVESADGVAISFEVAGQGEPTLVFIHGWSCDARYWRAQIPHFSRHHRVVAIDLAGHGHSGFGRAQYSMGAFGQDMNAVLDTLGAEQVILIGHSMGGPVSVAAAASVPERVIGIIGVDTFQSVNQAMSAEEAQSWLNPLREDFRNGARAFVAGMFIDDTDAALRDWVVADMAAAPPEVALSAMEQMLAGMISGEAGAAFASIEVPIVAINADIWPTDTAGNRQLRPGFETVIMDNADHFLHMAKPEAFNKKLELVITGLLDQN